jgi:hypothetical protein
MMAVAPAPAPGKKINAAPSLPPAPIFRLLYSDNPKYINFDAAPTM